MATTYEIIDKTILTSSQSSVSFTGLGAYSSDYTDLLLRVSGRNSFADTMRASYLSFNGSTSNFSSIYLQGAGSGTPASGSLARYLGGFNASTSTSSTFSSTDLYIPNYSSSNYKSYSIDHVSENNATFAFCSFQAGLWSDTSAITSIAVAPDSSDWVSGSTFYLYGIKNS
jgi:hypothetical protein